MEVECNKLTMCGGVFMTDRDMGYLFAVVSADVMSTTADREGETPASSQEASWSRIFNVSSLVTILYSLPSTK